MASLRVDRVSCALPRAGDMQNMQMALDLPQSEPSSSRVSLLFLNVMYSFGLLSDSLSSSEESSKRDLFIASVYLVLLLCRYFSEPAKSIMFSQND